MADSNIAGVRRVTLVSMPWRSSEMYRPSIESLRAGFIATGAHVTVGHLPAIQPAIDALREDDYFVFFGPPNLYRAHDARKLMPTLALGHRKVVRAWFNTEPQCAR